MKKTNHFLTLTMAISSLSFVACNSSTSSDQKELPATYSFENVSFTGQLERMAMLDELIDLGKKGNKGEEVSAQKLKDMFANANSPFSDSKLNESTKQLKSKTYADEVEKFEAWMDSLAVNSTSTEEGSAGVAGVVTSKDGSVSYLQDAKGVEYIQFIAKGLMGATFYYQAVAVYLNAEDGLAETVDNETVVEGQGTELAHHWDEGYGYYAGSTEFPAAGTGKHWASYAEKLDGTLNTIEPIMKAFIKGRAAILENDRATMLEAAEEVKAEWDRLIAACAVHYLNKAMANLTDDAIRNHALSEGWAFAYSLQFNPSKRISDSGFNKVLEGFGDDFYNITVAQLNETKDILVETYGFEEIADEL